MHQIKSKVPINQIKQVSNFLIKKGYCHIESKFYFERKDLVDLSTLQRSYSEIFKKGKNKGGRSRAYKRFFLHENKLSDVTGMYIQSKEYNKMDGGKKRKFGNINDKVINSTFFKKLLFTNISICNQTGLVNFENGVSIGVHQIRYLATNKSPAYSTPSGLHKDNEIVIFIHFVGQSSSRIGGVNYIAKNEDDIIEVIDMSKPGETIVLSKKYFHAVSPLGVKKGKKKAFRDVLIITFEPNCDFEVRASKNGTQ